MEKGAAFPSILYIFNSQFSISSERSVSMNSSHNARIPVGVLAATGAVGQRFVQLLAGHPWFELREVSGSDRGAGRPYGEVAAWRLPGGIPEEARKLIVRGPQELLHSPILFSALPA